MGGGRSSKDLRVLGMELTTVEVKLYHPEHLFFLPTNKLSIIHQLVCIKHHVRETPKEDGCGPCSTA